MPSQAHPSSTSWPTHSSHFRPKVVVNNYHSEEEVKSKQQSSQTFCPTYSIVPSFGGRGSSQENQNKAKTPNISSLNISKRIADFREQVRNEDLVLKSGVVDDHKALKGHVGGWAFTPKQMAHMKTTPYVYNASAGSYLEVFALQR